MKKLKWKYDNKYKEWWNASSFSIKKVNNKYLLTIDHSTTFQFLKLSSAKTVAELFIYG